jgi:Na+/H+ antiporter NhaD/arsenite permease-like protein
MAFSIIVFVVALGIIASERIDRTNVALLGATLLLLTGVLTQEEAVEAIDFNTIGLLVGMMIMVRLTEATGVYTWLAIRAGQWSKGRPVLLVLALGGTTAVLSAFLDNVTTVLLIVPITFLLADALDVDPVPLIGIEIFASNIGGTATLIGDPPNILIAGHTGLSFTAFITNLAPIVVITLGVVGTGLYFRYRSRLQVTDEARERVMGLDARRSIEDPVEAKRTVPILVATIIAFFFHKALGLEPATVALTGAAIMLLVTSQPLQDTIGGIEWATLFFLLGLFVMVGALEHTGALGEVADGIASITGGDHVAELLGILWASALGSGIVDNIPFTAAMLPVVDDLGGAHNDAYWWALSLGACFGGNLTIVAAAANVAASGMSARAGHPIGFMTFLKVGAPVTAVSLALATGYVLLRYA